jgi:sterol desaturase/sphingolipid hydroxylase (fatty acid hydroxylase superfamily)
MAYSLHHDYHHYRVRGNYGVLGLLDWVFKTDGPFVMLHKSHKAQEQKEADEQGSASGAFSLES